MGSYFRISCAKKPHLHIFHAKRPCLRDFLIYQVFDWLLPSRAFMCLVSNRPWLAWTSILNLNFFGCQMSGRPRFTWTLSTAFAISMPRYCSYTFGTQHRQSLKPLSKHQNYMFKGIRVPTFLAIPSIDFLVWSYSWIKENHCQLFNSFQFTFSVIATHLPKILG